MDLGGIVIEVADEHNWEGSVVTTINVNNNNNNNKLVNADNKTFQVQNLGNANVVNNGHFIHDSEPYVPQVLEYAVPGVTGAVNVQYGIENENSTNNVQYVQQVSYEENNYNVENIVQNIGTENPLNYSLVNKTSEIQISTNTQNNGLNNANHNVSYSVVQNNSNNTLYPQIQEVPFNQDANCQVQYLPYSENNNTHSQKRPLDNGPSPVKGSIASSKKEKIYQCPHCDYKTDVPRSLAIHIRRHTGEKPYLCDECGDSFTNPSDLLRHKIRHTDHREYQCGQCEEAFKDVAGINKHVKRMHYLNPGDISHYRFKEETTDRGEKILFIKVVKDSQPYVRRFRILKS